MISDTIAAIATSTAGSSAIGIIRVSGEEAIEIVNKLFKGKDLSTQKSHTIHYGRITCPDTHLIIDEVLVMLMRNPKSFTMEDVVEINCHGGTFVTKRILELVLTHGARHAHAGEFSKRAFLNGRIDLTEAESIMDLIEAKSDHALKLAVNALDGKVTQLIKALREALLEVIATIEVNIDYPEYDEVEEMTHDSLRPKSLAIHQTMAQLLHTAKTGQLIKNGLKTAIIGRPNVGKSSLLNQLMREDKAIVTNIAGTTRDTVEGSVNIGGLTLNLIDTAGIHQTDDLVESIGVEKSKKLIEEAELILLVLNANEPLTDEDKYLVEMTAHKHRIILLNKSDLTQKIKTDDLPAYILTSMTCQSGISQLEEAIKSLFEMSEMNVEETFLSNTRHISTLNKSMTAITNAIEQMQKGTPIDMVEIDLRTAWELLGEILGEDVSDSLIDELFTKFCLGK
ncbi:MAG: tRNA uridine-5-carboxymethylaminomethyl(34) synthesis GTPase MnmE [Defluviitaleaceae bacterium]|nr:tRNA uridine-5-carboxymethylaminomethyl(34) synthesis GTPase MnmE [Defluviitaleaceae bacterium]